MMKWISLEQGKRRMCPTYTLHARRDSWVLLEMVRALLLDRQARVLLWLCHPELCGFGQT